MRRVCVPDRYWLTTRPVVSQIGYSSSTTSAGSRNGTRVEAGLAVRVEELPALEQARRAGWPTSGHGQNTPISSSIRSQVMPA